MFGLDSALTLILLLCLMAAMAFEFINGFHDTANAVATVIYTNSLKPWFAVVWSGIWNAIGVFAGGIAVAMGITNLLPVEVLLDPNISHNLALIAALLITAISWNLGTWYLGIPSSSSHTLIGSILGVGIAYSFITNDLQFSSVNWSRANEIGLSLLFSPILGFSLAILLMYVLRQTTKNKVIFREPVPHTPPPFWIRLVLLLTCTGVSFSHGSNDGQKGVGLMMLILIALVPGYFTLDTSKTPDDFKVELNTIHTLLMKIDSTELPIAENLQLKISKDQLADFESKMRSIQTFNELNLSDKFLVRRDLILLGSGIKILTVSDHVNLSSVHKKQLKAAATKITSITAFAPVWVILLISLSLGLGTLIGWKRIVTTIGEKIGKQHLTYAQGASAEIIAASTISFSTWLGLPVSTTHILSSGVAGTMVASKGVKNLQPKTIKTIALAWLLTLPVCIVLSGSLFLLFRMMMD